MFRWRLLKRAAELDPNTWWWIKGDSVDVVKGIKKSTRGEWSRDIDLNDSYLKLLYEEYQDRLSELADCKSPI